MKILIADDDRVSSLILRNTLEKMGHEVTTAASGTDGWQKLQEEEHHVVISDWMTTGIDGPELCRLIRGRNTGSYTYVLLFTGRSRRDDRFRGLKAGADDFLAKPLDTSELEARLGVAQRILDMQQELQRRSAGLDALGEDLTDKNTQLEEALTYLGGASLRFQELFQGVPFGCYTYDREGRIQEWNRAAEALYGYRSEEVFERYIWDTVSKADDENATKDIVAGVFSGNAFTGLIRQDRRSDGSLIDVQCSTFPLKSSDGNVYGAISANVDITDRIRLENQVKEQLNASQVLNALLAQQREKLAQANARLQLLATTDELTGLRNHRSFREGLEQSFALARRQNLPLTVILVDVDDFKKYNDSFGHPAGNYVLQATAAALLASARKQDIVARYGGEEFVVILPGTDVEGGAIAAERMRREIEETPREGRKVTASFGVATMTPDTINATDLVDQADLALYLSKENGRNQVTNYTQAANGYERGSEHLEVISPTVPC